MLRQCLVILSAVVSTATAQTACQDEASCRAAAALLPDEPIFRVLATQTKGCFGKGGKVYWSAGGSEEENAKPVSGKKSRVYCEGIVEDDGETKNEAISEIGRPVLLTEPTPQPDEISVDAVIVGAGWAGISTARDLQNSGYSSFLILEANNYVGGRSKSNNSDGTLNVPPVDLPSSNVPIEMGSEWLYQSGSQYSYLRSGGFLSKVDINRDR